MTRHRPIVAAVDRPTEWPWALHIDGGGWAHGQSGLVDSGELARAGITTFDAVPRDLDTSQHPAAMLDAERALRWVLGHRVDQSLDAQAGLLVGSGTGAHSLLSAYCGSPALRREFMPAAIVVVDPAVDPYTTWLRTGQSGDEGLAAFFGSPERMRRAVVAEQILDGVAARLPDLTILETGAFSGPPESIDELSHAWRRAGGRVTRRADVADRSREIGATLASARIDRPNAEEALR